MVNEAITDDMIAKKLDDVDIEYTPQGGCNKLIDEAFKGGSKTGKKGKGAPDFTAQSGDFILVIEDKADTNKQIKYINEKELDLSLEAINAYAVNGAVHYAQHIIKNSHFNEIFCSVVVATKNII